MNIKSAARLTSELMVKEHWPADKQKDDEADSYKHVKWMLNGIIEGYICNLKAHRWLGWAQAIIHVHQGAILEEFKQINKRA